MDAYSLDLRKKIVEAKERGMPTVEVAKTFGVGVSTVKRYAATARQPRAVDGPLTAAEACAEAGRAVTERAQESTDSQCVVDARPPGAAYAASAASLGCRDRVDARRTDSVDPFAGLRSHTIPGEPPRA